MAKAIWGNLQQGQVYVEFDPDLPNGMARLNGRWYLQTATMEQSYQECAHLELQLIQTEEPGAQQSFREEQREKLLAEAPEDVRKALEALYALEKALPSDQEAIVDVSGDEGSRFQVRVVEAGSED